jgi:hypothetical protein
MVQNSISKGKRVKYDIASSNFEKRKKKVSNIRLRKLSDNFKRVSVDKKAIDVVETPNQLKKTPVRVRPSLASIDLVNLKMQKRNNSD